MATRVISATGGNWNSTATWVGGVIPTTADDILGDATSGNLTMNVTGTIQFANFSAYTGTLTINSGFELRIQGTTTTETSFNTGMTISGAGFILHGNGRLRSNGLTIPNLALAFSNTTTTLMDNISVSNLITYLGNTNKIINDFQFNITNYSGTTLGSGTVSRFNGTTLFNFNAANCSYTTTAVSSFESQIRNPITIDTPGNFTINGFLNLAAGTTLTYQQGTILGDKIIRIGNFNGTGTGSNVNNTTTINTSGITWDSVWIETMANVLNITDTYSFTSDFNFDKMIIPSSFFRTLSFYKKLIFTGGFNGNSLSAYGFTALITGNSLATDRTPNISFSTGATYNIGELNITGTDTTSTAKIKSATSGVKATLNLTGNTQNVLFTDFTDIDASAGNTIYTYKGIVSNCDNVLSTDNYVPTSSLTFISS